MDSTTAGSIPSKKLTTTPFSLADQLSLSREMVLMSACRLITQKPPSVKPPVPGSWAFHQTGAVRRSSANSASGRPRCIMSGSTKSNGRSSVLVIAAISGGVIGVSFQTIHYTALAYVQDA